MPNVIRALAPSSLALLFAACASTPQTVQVAAPQQPIAPPPPPGALVRVIHASPEQFAQIVAAYTDNGQVPVIPELHFGAAEGYLPVPAGVHSVQARVPGMPPTGPAPVNWNTPDMAAGHVYTIIAHGLVSDLSGPQLTFAHEEDELAVSTPGRTRLRFFHALVGGGNVDVCLNGATPAFTAAAYGAFANAAGVPGHYAASQPGAVTVTFRAANPAACTGRIVGSVPLQLVDGVSVLLVATGRIARGQTGVAPQVLLCPDTAPQAASCTPIPVTPGR
jgi:Domain of unknown function (DUF4397)